jgi:murein DD-endopeptidase MepM/ murein hydrolase activator NlpD
MNHTAQAGTSSVRGRRRTRLLAGFAVLAVVLTGTLSAPAAALAADYPSWNDVLKARQNAAAAAAQVASIKNLVAGLQAQVTATQAVAEAKGTEAQLAQQKYDIANQKAMTLKAQADADQLRADQSKQRAGQLAAQLSRTGGGDLTATLFFNGQKADDLLSQLGLASKVSTQSQGLYTKAVRDQNTARSATNQADVAKTELKKLADVAQKALDDAQSAADAAAAALAEQSARQATLSAQLATLTTDVVHTEAEYLEGVKQSYGPGAGLGAGQIVDGWAKPANGQISSPYGYRVHPVTGAIDVFHSGTDIGASCNAPIYAAHGGTVVHAGPYGGYGNYVKIRNDDGTNLFTAYGHIVAGGILVSVGQSVGVGQNIAKVGSTGVSTGCHLHFEIYQGAGTIDPAPFMRNHGVPLG